LYRLDKPFVTHAHREGHLIFYIDGGRALTRVSDRAFRCGPDFGIAINPWEPHSFEPMEEACLCLVLYIKPTWFLDHSVSVEFALSFGSSQIRVTPSLSNLRQRLTGLLLDDGGRQQFDALLYNMTRISFDQSWQDHGQRLVDRTSSHFCDFRVRKSLRLIRDHLTEDFEMEQYAKEAGLSRPHFFKLFKKQMGITPNVYQNTLRSEQAIEDLLSTSKSITEIGYDLGFSSQASFTRFFTSNVGISPSEYRRVSQTA